MNSGYLPLWRRFKNHPLWKERRVYSKAEAWIDILFEARWQDHPNTTIIGNKTLVCNYGEILYSLDTWAERWRWSKSRVKRVFVLFEQQQMIEVKNETVTTRIRVCNYSKYDPRRNGEETQEKRNRNARETQSKPTEEGKEGKEGKKTRKEDSMSGSKTPDAVTPPPCAEIIAYLNRKCGKAFKPNAKESVISLPLVMVINAPEASLKKSSDLLVAPV